MRILAYVLLGLGAIGIAGVSLAGLFVPEIQSPVFSELVSTIQWSGTLHIAAGAAALFVGLFQLSRRLRARSLQLHINLGRLYVLLVLLSSLGAMVSLPVSTAGIVAKSAFWLLAILWPTVTLMGYPFRSSFSRRWHGRCMIISYALTCSAISLRIFLGSQLAMGISFEVCYPISAWGGILVNLAIAIFILRKTSHAKLATPKPSSKPTV